MDKFEKLNSFKSILDNKCNNINNSNNSAFRKNNFFYNYISEIMEPIKLPTQLNMKDMYLKFFIIFFLVTNVLFYSVKKVFSPLIREKINFYSL